MPRSDRLFDILQILRDGRLHRAQDMADRLGVSVRTVYRDMDRLTERGLPVEGTPGSGYRVQPLIALPPLSLTPAELEVLQLGLAIVAEAADAELRTAAAALADKIDAALPEDPAPGPDMLRGPAPPFASAARGLSHMATLRAAIKGRQKLALTHFDRCGQIRQRVIRPLHLDYFGRIWTLTAWCELGSDFRVFRVDLVETATALPEFFVDEPGRRLADYRTVAGQT